MKNFKNMSLIYKADSKISINEIIYKKFFISTRLKNKLITTKNIFLNGSFVDTRTYVNVGDIVTIDLNIPEDNSNILPMQMDLNIIYEDSHILALNKPSGIAVHPSILHYNDSLSNGVKYYFDNIGLKKKIRPVNRIDLNTSGLVLFAKNEYIQESLIRQMNNNNFKKIYLTLVTGSFQTKEGIINLPIARKENSIIERCVSESGQTAITHYKVIKEYEDYSLVECLLETGRTHQIRVHMAHISHPIIGDTLYNTKKNVLIGRQALHSSKMEFIHPVSNKKITLKAPLPLDMQKLIF